MEKRFMLRTMENIYCGGNKLLLTGGLAQLGGKVFARNLVRPLTVGVSPNCVLLNPQLRQAAGSLCAMLANVLRRKKVK
jgi:hypothetical protein